MAVNMITIDYQINGRMVILTLSFWSGERFCRLRGGQTSLEQVWSREASRHTAQIGGATAFDPRPAASTPPDSSRAAIIGEKKARTHVVVH